MAFSSSETSNAIFWEPQDTKLTQSIKMPNSAMGAFFFIPLKIQKKPLELSNGLVKYR
jgi:hypothetical protein